MLDIGYFTSGMGSFRDLMVS